jgi:hypothetical protein
VAAAAGSTAESRISSRNAPEKSFDRKASSLVAVVSLRTFHSAREKL